MRPSLLAPDAASWPLQLVVVGHDEPEREPAAEPASVVFETAETAIAVGPVAEIEVAVAMVVEVVGQLVLAAMVAAVAVYAEGAVVVVAAASGHVGYLDLLEDPAHRPFVMAVSVVVAALAVVDYSHFDSQLAASP